MSTTITYSAPQRKQLKTEEWRGSVSPHGVRRAIKMVKPICFECQDPWPAPQGWWNDCPHRPYERMVPKTIKHEVYRQDEDGDTVLDEEETKRASKKKMILVPNVVEVMLHQQVNDGRGPEKMSILKGFKSFPEAGYAPMCEAYGCGRAWPTFKSDEYGTYCGEAHARLCAMKEDEIFSLAGSSADVSSKDVKKARRDLERNMVQL